MAMWTGCGEPRVVTYFMPLKCKAIQQRSFSAGVAVRTYNPFLAGSCLLAPVIVSVRRRFACGACTEGSIPPRRTSSMECLGRWRSAFMSVAKGLSRSLGAVLVSALGHGLNVVVGHCVSVPSVLAQSRGFNVSVASVDDEFGELVVVGFHPVTPRMSLFRSNYLRLNNDTFQNTYLKHVSAASVLSEPPPPPPVHRLNYLVQR